MSMHRIELQNLEVSDYRHPSFGEAYRPFFERMSRLFAEECPGSPEEWEDDFRRDLHPDREIMFWTMLADFFEHFTQGKGWELGRRKELFGVLLACLGSGPKDALGRSYSHLARPFVKRVVHHVSEVLGGRICPIIVSGCSPN
jgi:hypothetical protein